MLRYFVVDFWFARRRKQSIVCILQRCLTKVGCFQDQTLLTWIRQSQGLLTSGTRSHKSATNRSTQTDSEVKLRTIRRMNRNNSIAKHFRNTANKQTNANVWTVPEINTFFSQPINKPGCCRHLNMYLCALLLRHGTHRYLSTYNQWWFRIMNFTYSSYIPTNCNRTICPLYNTCFS